MPTLPLKTSVAAFTAALVIAIAGCFGAHTRDDDVVQVWPPLDEAAPSGAGTASLTDSPAGPSRAAPGSSPYGQEVLIDRTARGPSTAAGTPPAVAAITDPRLTPDQRELLDAQLASWPGSENAGASTNPAAPNLEDIAPPPGKGLQSYVAQRLVPEQPTTPGAPAAPASAEVPAANTSTPATATPASALADSGSASTAASVPPKPPAASATPATSPIAPNPAPAAGAGTPAESTKAGAADAEASGSDAANTPTGESPNAAQANSDESTSAVPSNNSAAGPDVEASAARESNSTADAHSSNEPSPQAWRSHLDESITALEQQLSAADLDATERLRLEGTLRLMYVAAGRREDAVRAIETAESREQEFWKQCMFALLELVEPEGPPVASRRAKLALRPLREALQQLASLSSLDVRNLAICQKVESFGRYTEFTPYEFRPEQEVILYVEVSNFASEAKADGFETEFHGSYQILDSSGRRIVDYDLMRDQQICRNVRTDYFLPYRIYLPKNLSAGTYQLQVTIEDKKGQKFGQTPPVEFKITG